MGYGIGILFLAVGAILTFATNITVSGVDLDAVGVILMIIGGLGLLISLLLATDYHNSDHHRHTDYHP